MFVELHHFWILFFHQAADQNPKEKKEIKNGAPQQTFDPSYFVRTLVALCSDFWEERISSIISPVLIPNWGLSGVISSEWAATISANEFLDSSCITKEWQARIRVFGIQLWAKDLAWAG